jgi:hypothetical protein
MVYMWRISQHRHARLGTVLGSGYLKQTGGLVMGETVMGASGVSMDHARGSRTVHPAALMGLVERRAHITGRRRQQAAETVAATLPVELGQVSVPEPTEGISEVAPSTPSGSQSPVEQFEL